VFGLADQTAQAIDRALLYEAERSAREKAEDLAARLIRLQQVATELGGAATVDEVAEVVVTHAAEVVGSGLATLSLLVDADTFEIVKTRGVSAGAVERWHRYPATENLPTGLAIRSGEPVVLTGRAEILERFPGLAGENAMPEGALICVPMHVGRRAIGAISLTFPAGRTIGSRAELAFFASLADNCAQAIERARAVSSLETAVAKLSLLAEATGELVGSHDFRSALTTLAELMVPKLADWCAIDIVLGDGIERVAVAHVDPTRLEAARALHDRYPPSLDDESAVPRVLRNGVSVLIPLITDEMLVAQSSNDEQLRLGRELGLRSAMVVPMRGTSTIGAITLVHSDESGRRYDTDDLTFAEDIARRAGAAIENVMSAEVSRGERGAVDGG
jgi:GAF domain-containing protein